MLAVHLNDRGARWTADLLIEDNAISGHIGGTYETETFAKIPCKKSKLKKSGKFTLWCQMPGVKNRSVKGDRTTAKLRASGRAGGAVFRFVSGADLDDYLRQVETDEELTTDQYYQAKGE